jgi:hypothetical protein
MQELTITSIGGAFHMLLHRSFCPKVPAHQRGGFRRTSTDREQLEESVRNLKSPLIAALAAILTATPALAAELSALVVPVLPSVSLSIGGSEPAASYTVTLTNTSTSAGMNTARLVGATSVTAGTTGAKAVYKSSAGATCTPTNVDKTSIDCSVGALAVSASKTFTVTFTSPTSGSAIAFAWQAVFDNGTPPGNSNGDYGTQTIGLDPIDISKVVSDVPANVAVTFFTGSGIATPTDPWVTKVKVSSTTAASTALVDEAIIDCVRAPDLLDCRTTLLTIPGSTFGIPGARPLSQFLEITLLRDASTIGKGAKIDSAVVYYQKLETDAFQVVPDCTDTSYGLIPRAGLPCEDRGQRTAYPKRNTARTPVQAGYESDWKFVIYAFDNGRYNQ